jgi:hypothetical protein
MLSDLADILKDTLSGARRLLIGDWNSDVTNMIFPCPPTAPVEERGGRNRHRANFDHENWLALNAYAEDSKLKYSFASVMLEIQQFEGKWPLDAPISRVPSGEQALTSAPSWLDWGLAPEGLECPSKISWRDVPANHAWVLWELKLQFKRHPKRPPTTWRCQDEEKFVSACCHAC